MKPFNLEEALAGKPVVTRNGRKVLQLIKFNMESEYCLFVNVEGIIEKYKIDGSYGLYDSFEYPEDLFMADETI